MRLKPVVDMYSHHFIISNIDSVYQNAIERFARRLVETETMRDRFGNIHTSVTKVYAVRHQFELAYRFHINMYTQFKASMNEHGLSLPEPIKHAMYTPDDAGFVVKDGWTPRDAQVPVVNYLVDPGVKKVVDAQTGSGKGLLHGTPVRTIDGWTPVEKLSVGDKVMGETGEFHNVTGVFPQGEKRLFEIEFKDGRTIITDDTHLWEVRYKSETKVISSYELFELMGTAFSPVITPKLAIDPSNCEYNPKDYNSHIQSVTSLTYTGYTTCISVDNPTKLFVTKDYIVTHNTIMALFAIARMNVRTALVIKPMYISRWMDVLVGDDKFFAEQFKPKDVMTVRGSAQLASLINLGRADELNVSFIVISNRTYLNYLKHYKEHGPSEEYGWVKPEELWEVLGVGIRIIDEAHQDFFGCFLTDLHSHVPKSIELSGSLIPDKDFLKGMYEIMYPKDLRMNTGAYKRYVDVIALFYELDPSKPEIRTTRRGRNSYSQAAYEENLLKDKSRLESLKRMMLETCDNFFIAEQLADHKLLVFFDTVEMCKVMAEAYQAKYPQFYVSPYTQEEDPDVLDEADIIVATPASAGTAVDITNLQQVHCFVMRSSSQALIQMIGRLRQLSTDTISPKYIYFTTNSIVAHQRYHAKIYNTYRLRAKTQEARLVNNLI